MYIGSLHDHYCPLLVKLMKQKILWNGWLSLDANLHTIPACLLQNSKGKKPVENLFGRGIQLIISSDGGELIEGGGIINCPRHAMNRWNWNLGSKEGVFKQEIVMKCRLDPFCHDCCQIQRQTWNILVNAADQTHCTPFLDGTSRLHVSKVWCD